MIYFPTDKGYTAMAMLWQSGRASEDEEITALVTEDSSVEKVRTLMLLT